MLDDKVRSFTINAAWIGAGLFVVSIFIVGAFFLWRWFINAIMQCQ